MDLGRIVAWRVFDGVIPRNVIAGCSTDLVGERLNGIQEVRSSILLVSTKRKRPVKRFNTWRMTGPFYMF